MPQLALAVAGAAIGGAIAPGVVAFGMTGSAIGWAAGSLLGSAFAPNQKAQGPRLSDLKAGQVSYGSVIPYVEGHPRIPGIVIWASEKREIATTTEEGGKGGGGVEVTSYTYEQDILYMLTENEMSHLRRVWWNGELVWSRAEDSDPDSLDNPTERWSRLTFYSGADDQQPDPTYEAAVGTKNAPAYLGRATVFIESLQLGSNGVMPNLTFEVVSGDPSPSGQTAVREWVYELENTASHEETVGAVIPPGAYVGGDDLSLAVLRRVRDYDVDVAVEEDSVRIVYKDGRVATVAKPFGLNAETVRGNADRTVLAFAESGGQSALHLLGDDLHCVCTAPANDWLGTVEMRYALRWGFVALATSLPLASEPDDAWSDVASGTLGNVYIFDLGGNLLETIAHGASVQSLALTNQGLYVLSGSTITLYDYETWAATDTLALPDGSEHVIFGGLHGALDCANAEAEVYEYDPEEEDWELRATFAATDEDGPVDLGTGNATHMATEDKVYAVIKKQKPGPARDDYRWRWSGHPNTEPAKFYEFLEDSIKDYAKFWAGTFHWSSGQLRARKGLSWVPGPVTVVNIYDTIYTLDRASFVNIYLMVKYGYPLDSDPAGYYPFSTSSTCYRFLYQEGAPTTLEELHVYRAISSEVVRLQEPTLQEVVERQCQRGGLSLDYVDATALEGVRVRAMVLSQAMSPRQAIEMLQSAYFFTPEESGGVLKFRARGGAPVATIPHAHLVAGQGGEDPLSVTKANDLELPSQVFLKYSNINDDYQEGSESSDRLVSSGQSSSQVELPLAFTPTEARRIADAQVMDMAASVLRFGPFGLTREYANLEPSDVVLLTDGSGMLHRARLVRKSEAAGVLTFEAVSDDADVIASPILSEDGGYTNSTVVRPPVDTVMELLDIPLLSDADNGIGLYAVGKAATNVPWPGAALLKSADDVTFAAVGTTSQEGVFGSTKTALGDGPTAMFDEVGAVTVDVGHGVLSSVTREALLSGSSNTILLGDEIVRFRSAAMVSTGVYRLSGLLRGRKGTEWATGSHTVGERAVLLNSAIRRVGLDNAELGAPRYWKAVTLGRNASTAESEEFTTMGVSQKPYAPSDVRFERDTSGNLTITLKRRTRMGFRYWGPLGSSVPLGEESERYELDILDGGNVVRTLTSTNGNFSYSASNQSADFGSPQSTLDVEAYQISAAVGRGYGTQATG